MEIRKENILPNELSRLQINNCVETRYILEYADTSKMKVKYKFRSSKVITKRLINNHLSHYKNTLTAINEMLSIN